MSSQVLAAAIEKMIDDKLASMRGAYCAIFLNNNALDANLCDIQLVNGTVILGCPRITGLTFNPGDALLVISGLQTPMIVVGAYVGDITVYTQ